MNNIEDKAASSAPVPDHLELFEEASEWAEAMKRKITPDMVELLGWLTSAANLWAEKVEGRHAATQAPAPSQPKGMVLIGWQYRDANDDGTWGAWLGCDKRLEHSQWRQVRGVYAAAPSEAHSPRAWSESRPHENNTMSQTQQTPGRVSCPKCGATSGNDWTQCGGSCPMLGSPHYKAPVLSNQAPAPGEPA